MTGLLDAGTVAALVGLGAFHGLNPGMGWLFAVALGLQERDRGAVWRAVPPIAAGHGAAILAAVFVLELVRSVVSPRAVAIGTAAVLVVFGLWRLIRQRHVSWAAMRVSRWELAGWSFLMATAHGAGLMLFPVLLAGGAGSHPVTGLAATGFAGVSSLGAAVVHTAGMVAIMGPIALLIYDRWGLAILRTHWVNLNVIWAVTLIAAGVFALFA